MTKGQPLTEAQRMQEKELRANLNKQIKMTFHKIHFNMDQIDCYITRVFKEFNELNLIHESKLGQTLKDMQQFLQYYDTCDEDIRNLLNKTNMIIEIQEKKMFKEIFGENKLYFEHLRKMTLKEQKDKA